MVIKSIPIIVSSKTCKEKTYNICYPEADDMCTTPAKQLQAMIGKSNINMVNHYSRTEFSKEYGFAVMCKEVIDILKAQQRVLEVGCGSGYISKMIGNAIATNYDPKGNWEKVIPNKHCEIEEIDGAEAVKKYADKVSAVLISWPYMTTGVSSDRHMWYVKMLRHMRKGQHLIFIGETKYGCCANDLFFDLVERQFHIESNIYIPQWNMIHDRCVIYRKK